MKPLTMRLCCALSQFEMHHKRLESCPLASLVREARDELSSSSVRPTLLRLSGADRSEAEVGVRLEPLGWPNPDFLLAYMAMAPLRSLSLFYNGPSGW
jgi:hypothetical protein